MERQWVAECERVDGKTLPECEGWKDTLWQSERWPKGKGSHVTHMNESCHI